MLDLVLVVILAYALLALGLYLAQDRLIFPRHLVRPFREPLPPRTERVTLTAADGVIITGNLVRASRRSQGLLLGFAGNAWNADDFTSFLAKRIDHLDVVAFHYRGYAPSAGRPSEAALNADALAIYDRLTERLRPSRVFVAGFSLGSGVGIALAAERAIAGLVLFTPFDSLAALAKARYGWLPIDWLLRHPFRSDERLRAVDVPAAVVLAADDRITPAGSSAALIARLRRPVGVETVPDSTHVSIYHLPAVDGALRRALVAVGAGLPTLEERGSLRERPAGSTTDMR